MKILLLIWFPFFLFGCEDTPTQTQPPVSKFSLDGKLIVPPSASNQPDTISLVPADWTLATTYSTKRWRLLRADGTYHFENIPQGAWRISFRRDTLLWGRTLNLSKDTVLPDATPVLGCIVFIPLALSDSSRGGLIYPYGQDQYAHIPDTGNFALLAIGPLPAGRHTLQQTRWNGTVMQEAHILITAGATDTLKSSAWHPCCNGPMLDTSFTFSPTKSD